MPKPKVKKTKKTNEVKIKKEYSSLGEFVKRSLPSDEEVKKFDEFTEEEAREEDIEESLSEIYEDDKGGAVDVKKLDIKKKRGFFFWLFSFLFMGAVLAGTVYGFYYIYYEKGTSISDIQFSIEAEKNVSAGEEFFYTVDYKNLSNIGIGDIEIKLNYPDNFIYLDSVPAPELNNNSWNFNNLDAHRSAQIKIKGKILGEKDESDIITGSMTYVPTNFSSSFKKEAAFENSISDIGIEISIEAPSGVLVDEESEIIVKYKADEDDNYLNSFRLTVEQLENMKWVKGEDDSVINGEWQINEITEDEQEISIKFNIFEKIEQTENLIFKFEYSEDGENYYKFYEEEIGLEVIKSDLNLNLIINGSRNDQGVDLGQTLNYSIVYANKGETEMENIVIMAVLDSDVIDWQSIDDKNNGQVGESIITWSKEEIPELALLDTGEEGIIDFSIDLLPFDEIELESGKKYEIKSYAQFSISNIEAKENEDTKSNTIINKINSDLTLDEQVRYFNDDNIAVGTGPLPPKVGEVTSYKIYWTLTNNLHELENLKVSVNLPENVSWDNKNRSTAGTVKYNDSEREITWNVGRLPISVYKAEAEFNISLMPTDEDINKIMVLLSGTSVEAVDSETNSIISKIIKAKTTRLEDDIIAETDGRIVK